MYSSTPMGQGGGGWGGGGSGYAPYADRLSKNFYDRVRREGITEVEAEALHVEERLMMHFRDRYEWVGEKPNCDIKLRDGMKRPTLDEINAVYSKGLGHDAINSHICVKALCKAAGGASRVA